MKKITWKELEKAMWDFNEEHGYTHKGNKLHLEGVVVFTANSFNKYYSEESRSYLFTSDNKAFLPNQLGYSIFANCLDGTDDGVRIDWYMKDTDNPWKVEYCYLIDFE